MLFAADDRMIGTSDRATSQRSVAALPYIEEH